MKFRLGLKLLSMQDFGLKNNNSFYKIVEILNCVKAIKDFFIYLRILTNSYNYLFVAPIYKLVVSLDGQSVKRIQTT